MYNVRRTLYAVQYTLYDVHCTSYSRTIWTVQCTLYRERERQLNACLDGLPFTSCMVSRRHAILCMCTRVIVRCCVRTCACMCVRVCMHAARVCTCVRVCKCALIFAHVCEGICICVCVVCYVRRTVYVCVYMRVLMYNVHARVCLCACVCTLRVYAFVTYTLSTILQYGSWYMVLYRVCKDWVCSIRRVSACVRHMTYDIRRTLYVAHTYTRTCACEGHATHKCSYESIYKSCTLYIIQCSLYCAHCTLNIVQRTLYAVQCTCHSYHI